MDNRTLLAGCSERFREALIKARQTNQLGTPCHRDNYFHSVVGYANSLLSRRLSVDLFTLGSASLSDFTRVREIDPDALMRVALPLVDYTLLPQKRPWQAYIPELVHLITKVQAGKMKWPLLDETLFPKLQAISNQLPPADWSMQKKGKVMGYTMLMLFVLKRGWAVTQILVRILQLVLLRYCAQQLLKHLDKNFMAKSILSKL